MEWIETTGRSVEEAIDAALDELGVNEDDIEYEVLEQPRGGFLGRFGGSEARIRARVRPLSREKPGERKRRRRDDRRGDRRESGDIAAARTEPAGESREPRVPERAGGGDSRRSRSRRPNERRPGERAGEQRRDDRGDREGRQVSDTQVPLETQAEYASGFVGGLLQELGISAKIASRVEGDDDVFVDVTGDDLGVLIGPRAVTLDAIQEVARTAVQHQTGGSSARVHVDVSGYRARRNAALAAFATEAADRAKTTGRDQVLEPMSPPDRKVVHDTVNALDGVATVSEGEEPRRRVVIKPV